jgi:hypothetical protein
MRMPYADIASDSTLSGAQPFVIACAATAVLAESA